MRRIMIALICAIVLPVVVGGCWFLKVEWSFRQHLRHVKECREEFHGYTPEQWANVARTCRSYWEAARTAEAAGIAQPPLPSLLTKLEPVYYDVKDDGMQLSWTDGFDDSVLNLDFRINDGKATLWAIGAHDDVLEQAVWSELNPLPESRDR